MQVDTLIRYGGAVKVLEKKGDLVTVGGPGVVFDSPDDPTRDLVGDYFTKDSYFGAHKGNGMDVIFHHGFPVSNLKFAQELSQHIFSPVKVEENEQALVGAVVLDMRKEYERFVGEKVEQKALGWSTGAIGHMVRRTDDGWLKVWPIGEWSLTPTPAEPRTSALPLKSLLSMDSAKAMSLNERLDQFYDAFRQAFDFDHGWLARVYDQDGYVIAEVDGEYFRIPFSMEDGEIVYANQALWTEVEKREEWVAAKRHYEQRMRGAKATAPALDDLLQQIKLTNINRRFRQRGHHA